MPAYSSSLIIAAVLIFTSTARWYRGARSKDRKYWQGVPGDKRANVGAFVTCEAIVGVDIVAAAIELSMFHEVRSLACQQITAFAA